MSVYLRPDEMARLRLVASARGQSVSKFVRDAALGACAAPVRRDIPRDNGGITWHGWACKHMFWGDGREAEHCKTCCHPGDPGHPS